MRTSCNWHTNKQKRILRINATPHHRVQYAEQGLLSYGCRDQSFYKIQNTFLNILNILTSRGQKQIKENSQQHCPFTAITREEDIKHMRHGNRRKRPLSFKAKFAHIQVAYIDDNIIHRRFMSFSTWTAFAPNT
jgi:hypothetical protein